MAVRMPGHLRWPTLVVCDGVTETKEQCEYDSMWWTDRGNVFAGWWSFFFLLFFTHFSGLLVKVEAGTLPKQRFLP